MLNATVNVNLNAPELVNAILQLAEALTGKTGTVVTGKPEPLPIRKEPEKSEKPKAEPATVEPAAPAPASEPEPAVVKIDFEEIHKALLDLKFAKSAQAVRDILAALGCKTVQDIPKERYADVLQMVSEAA